MSHTETPWQICANDPAGIEDSHGNMNLFVSGDVTSITEDKANAAYIVECVNAHEALTQQNKALRDALVRMKIAIAQIPVDFTTEWAHETCEEALSAVDQARAALEAK